MQRHINIDAVKVPNPYAMKFETPGLLLTPGSHEFRSKQEAEASPLAAKLFNFDYVARVFIAKNFVTVTKFEELPSWDDLSMEIRIIIRKHLEDGQQLFNFDHTIAPERPALGDPMLEAMRDLIEGPVAQATWQDGGEITFQSFEDGVLKVKMAGACIACPFAPRTLKHGVEVLLKRQFPEVESVTSDDVNWDDTQQV
jgi:NFU1 iron-sulfur cluster scaffold homolog, mitochondrial